MMLMPVIIFGKDGQIGRELANALRCYGEVILLGRSDCDITDEAAVIRVVMSRGPSIVINAAAFTAVDAAEVNSHRAYTINDVAVSNLSKICEAANSLLIHYSTDYVFDGGKSGAYLENDSSRPLSVYGSSKWAGEQSIRRYCSQHLILRVGWIYSTSGTNFLKTILKKLETQELISVIGDQYGAPTSAEFVARATAAVVNRFLRKRPVGSMKIFPVFGTYNIAASGRTSWFEYARFVATHAEELGFKYSSSPDQLVSVSTDQYRFKASADKKVVAHRPLNSCLDTAKFSHSFAIDPPLWQDDVIHTMKRLKAIRDAQTRSQGCE